MGFFPHAYWRKKNLTWYLDKHSNSLATAFARVLGLALFLSCNTRKFLLLHQS